MITPQQIDQISFSQARHGYDMEQVDKILEPLTEDYVKLYKENALLKSKMRVLVDKLKEYRNNEAAPQEDVEGARRTAEKMIQEAEAKCAQMLRQAKEAAAAAAVPAAAPAPKASPSADAFVAVEKARIAEAKKTAAARITEIQTQMQQCIQALDRIKNANVTPAAAPAPKAAAAPAAPAAPVAPAAPAAPVEKKEPVVDVYDNDAVVGEISQSLEAMVGTTTDTAPKAPPPHPTPGPPPRRFSNLNLQFGRNYDPTQK